MPDVYLVEGGAVVPHDVLAALDLRPAAGEDEGIGGRIGIAIAGRYDDGWATVSDIGALALRAAGSSEPRRHAELFVASLIGVLLQQLAMPRRGFRQETKAALLALVRGLIGKP